MRRRLTAARARGPRRLFFVLVLLPMFAVFPYLRAVNNPNEFVRVFTAMAMVDRQTFRIDDEVTMYGWTNDMARVKSKDDGQLHYFMVKAPGAVFLGFPGYAIFSKIVAPLTGHHAPTLASSQDERAWWLRMSTWSLRLFACQIPCFLFLLWFEKYLRAFSPDPFLRFAAVAAMGLGTNYLAYTHMFASHAQYAAIAFLAFAISERELRLSRGDPKARRWSKAALAGFFTSACVVFEYHALFLAVILSIFGACVFWRPTRLVAFALGGLVNIPGVMYFHWRAYGNPLTPGHQLLETQKFAIEHSTGLWGVVWPTWEHVKALSDDPGFGFFALSPFMAIGLVGLLRVIVMPYGSPSMKRSLRIASFVWFLCGLTLFLVNAGIIEWRGGWTVGPRYLAACPGFFAFGGVVALESFSQRSENRRAVARGLAGGLALASILSIGTVSLVYDTLPENIERPFAQFAFPMMMTGFVPHHVGEWFGWDSSLLWYIACAAMILTAFVAGLWPAREGGSRFFMRASVFVCAAGVAMIPALTKPPLDLEGHFSASFIKARDAESLFVLYRETRAFIPIWEPPGRDRITLLRADADRFGTRRPCNWYRLAYLERLLGNEGQALRDEAKAGQTSRDRCPILVRYGL